MRRGTTPAIPLTVNADITDWTVYVTLKNGRNILTLENDRLVMDYADGKTTIRFGLSQAETLAFRVGTCEVQVRAVKDGTAIATNIGTLTVGRILKGGEIDE